MKTITAILLCWASTALATPPTIGPIANQITYVDQPALIKLELADAETAVAGLHLTLVTSNPGLIQSRDYAFNWFFVDNHVYLCIAGAFGETGIATNTVTVSDGQASASTSFLMAVKPPPPGAVRFANESTVVIPDGGPADRYPSGIIVSNVPGTIRKLELTVSRFSHEYTADVSMLLVGPTGVGVVFLAKVGGGNAITDVTFTVSDSALFPFDPSFPIWPEIFRPTDYDPREPNGGVFADFNETVPNGLWELYIDDAEAPDHGQISGWSLLITTGPDDVISPAP